MIARLRACLLIGWLCGCDRFADLGSLEAAADGGVAATDSAGADLPVAEIDECAPGNAAGLEGERLAAARAGGPVAAGDRVLYPYDGTVFPAGLSAPLLMWRGARADAVYLQARSAGLRYQGCLVPSGANELELPSTLWREAYRTQRADEPLELELTTLTGETASGPLRLSLGLDTTAISGVLYVTSYRSLLAGPINLAAVMRLPLGGTVEPLLAPQGGCAGCHAVSANGATLLAALTGLGNWYDTPGDLTRDPLPFGSNVWGAEFAAIDPTGTFYLAPAHPPLLGPRSMGASPQLTATLFELASGAALPGTGIPEGAMTPAFSPDGKWLAFNDAAEEGHALALMAFAPELRSARDYRVVAADAASFPAWPAFRPGSEQVVFALGESSSFTGDGTLLSELWGPPGPRSDLHVAELDGSRSTMLFRAMGFESEQTANAGRSYLPFGDQDLHQNYHPSMLPRRAGAHDWLFFDSVRNYGSRGIVRGVWCAALEVNTAAGVDPSHPPFFVPGQEEGAAHVRPIAARRDELRER